MTTIAYPFLNSENDDIDAKELFRYAVEQGCSDIHIKPGSPPKLRIKGELLPIPGVDPLTPDQTEFLAMQTMSSRSSAQFEHKKYRHDYSYDPIGVGRFRMNAYKTLGNIALTARHLIDVPPTFDDLGSKESIQKIAGLPRGLILACGATGSGKTTLLAAFIQRINANSRRNIITAEDPVEILHTDIKSSVSQREVGVDVDDFHGALKDALREDPDVILIGEIRDLETAKAALKAAETGHLMLSTVHSETADQAITRFLEMFEGDQRSARTVLGGSLRAIVGQRLVMRADGTGRIAVNEILLNTSLVRSIIQDHDQSLSQIRDIIETSGEQGMMSFEQHLVELFTESLITEDVAIEAATFPERIIPMLEDAKERIAQGIALPVFGQLEDVEELEGDDGQKRMTAAMVPLSAKPVRPQFARVPRA